jgi:hypothetical protein
MAYGLDRFARAAAPHLETGEQIVGGTWARTPGGFAAERAGGVVVGIATQLGAADAGALRLPRAFEVAVTDRRLLFFDRSPVTGRPRTLVAAVDLAAVAVAELAPSRHGVEHVVVRMRSGATIDVEIAKLGARALAERFVACLDAQLTEPRPAAPAPGRARP